MVPHITSSSIIGVCSILAVGAIVEVILRHLRLFIASSVEGEEIFSSRLMIFLGAKEKRGLMKGKQGSVKTAPHVQLL